MLESSLDELLHENDDLAAVFPLHSNQMNKEIEAYDRATRYYK